MPTATSADGAARIDEYLGALDEPVRATLVAVRAMLHKVLPHGVECMKYGLPAVALDGKGVGGYGAFRDHCSYFPFSGSVLETAGELVAAYPVSKGGLQFPVGATLPVGLVRTLVELRLAELADVRDGRRSEYFADGRLKARGGMKDGELHGSWTWYRKDGTLMRTGRFTHGERTGTWTTWDSAGREATTTTF
jgi:uncharacterized protein YdhG (YjbR/CyaY superfamily)